MLMDLLAAVFGNNSVQLFLVGGTGGLARWLAVVVMDRKMALRQTLATIALGGIMGLIVSPAFVGSMTGALSAFSTDPARMPVLTAFTFGASGVLVFSLGLDWVTGLLKKLRPENRVDPIPPKTGDGS